MKKVMIVCGSMNRGGAERVISILSDALAQLGYEVTILTILDSGCGYKLNPKVDLINLSRKGQNQILSIPRLSKEIRREIKRRKPEVVISFMIAVNIVTWIATRCLKIKFVPSERNDPSSGRSAVFKVLQRIVYRQADTTVFQTQRAKSYFSKRVQKKGVVIPNPIRINAPTLPRKHGKIVTVGRLEPQKNQEMLIHAFASIHKKHPEYYLEIYGEGSLRTHLQELIDKLNLSQSVLLQGNHSDLHEQIADSEFFVLSSDYEGLSNALLEAMMMGIPCISTDCAGSDEAIKDHFSGLLVHVGDKEGLISAMDWMIENPTKASSLGNKGKETTVRYSTENVIDQWVGIIN